MVFYGLLIIISGIYIYIYIHIQSLLSFLLEGNQVTWDLFLVAYQKTHTSRLPMFLEDFVSLDLSAGQLPDLEIHIIPTPISKEHTQKRISRLLFGVNWNLK